ncbi:MAG: hypothetical protein PVF22_08580 [Candidatus Aminicenantes bacterium]|jgi:hypothetical protein
MRKYGCFVALLCLPVFGLGATLTFQSPGFDTPYYRIIWPLVVNQDGLRIKELRITDRNWEDFFLFLGGQNVDIGKPLSKGTYEVHIDYAWRSGKDYKVLLETFPENNPQKVTIQDAKGTAPGEGGIPQGKEGFYRIFRAEEQIGQTREAEISYLTFTARKTDLEGSEWILLEDSRQLEYQILDVKESTPPENAADTHPATLTHKITFPLDMPAFGKKILVLLLGTPSFSDDIGFAITGEDLGKTVRNKSLSLEFHPISGQINIIENVEDKIRLYNEAGVIHWNPGVFIPGVAWDHSFNWNPPPSFDEKIGKFLYINSRRGPLQKIKGVDLAVKYTIDKKAPYFISETSLVVNRDLGVKAIRNDEMVLYKELFDTLIYKNKQDRIVQMPLEEKPGYPDGFVFAAPENLDWVGLLKLNTENKYGFFSLRISSLNTNLGTAGDWLNKPGTYFYAPSSGKYVYWVRPLLYTWSEYPTRFLLTHVPAGSLFYEKNAYILLRLKKGYAKELDTLLLKLRNPVRIH